MTELSQDFTVEHVSAGKGMRCREGVLADFFEPTMLMSLTCSNLNQPFGIV